MKKAEGAKEREKIMFEVQREEREGALRGGRVQ